MQVTPDRAPDEFLALYSRYCHAVDDRDATALSSCFAADAEVVGERWIVESGTVLRTSMTCGRDDIVAMFMARSEGRVGYVHDTFNVLVDFDPKCDKIVGRAYFRIFTPQAEIECMGRYNDLLCREGGMLRFKRRIIRFTWGSMQTPSRDS